MRWSRADGLVGDLLRELDALGLAESTLIAVTSDHGEALWEHGVCGHGCSLAPHEELTRVPLILRVPGSAHRAAAVDTPVSTIDLAPTLLALAGIPIPHTMQGGMLPGLGFASETDRPVYVHCGSWLSVRRGDTKLIISRDALQGARFNIRNDPGEAADFLKQFAPANDGLPELARRYWPPESPPIETRRAPLEGLGPADRERLRALGYAE